jgi:ATP-dependent DNA helicase RecG
VLSFDELWELLTTQDESVEIEAKKASEVGKSCWDTITSLSNETGLGGGYLILGIRSPQQSESRQYEIEGLSEPDKIQCDLASQCSEVFSSVIRPRIKVATKESKTVIFVFIPEVQASEKPVYVKTRGLPKGACRRIASTDQKCTDRDIERFYQERSYQTFDQTPLEEASLDELESQAIETYRRLRKEVNPNASELNYSDRDLLHALFAITKHPDRGDEYCPTIAGMLLFGKEITLRRYFPMHRVDYIVVQGREWIADPDRRYQSVVEIREAFLI